MPTVIPSTAALDRILAVQLTIAWAGEQRSDPPGLGWWATSLSDPDGGGDFLKRMFPRTHVWAALGGMREAAVRADALARAQTADGDKLTTLFHFGFDIDEALTERLEHHLRRAVELASAAGGDTATPPAGAPADVLGKEYGIAKAFERAAFEAWLGGLAGKVAYTIGPAGRELAGPPAAHDEMALRLAGALLPLATAYPRPFYAASSEP